MLKIERKKLQNKMMQKSDKNFKKKKTKKIRSK